MNACCSPDCSCIPKNLSIESTLRRGDGDGDGERHTSEVSCMWYSPLLAACCRTPRALATAGGLKLSARRGRESMGEQIRMPQKIRDNMGMHGTTYIAWICIRSMAASPRCPPGVAGCCCRPCSLADSSPRRDCVFQVGAATSDCVQTPSVPATTASANQTGEWSGTGPLGRKGRQGSRLTQTGLTTDRLADWRFPIVTLSQSVNHEPSIARSHSHSIRDQCQFPVPIYAYPPNPIRMMMQSLPQPSQHAQYLSRDQLPGAKHTSVSVSVQPTRRRPSHSLALHGTPCLALGPAAFRPPRARMVPRTAKKY